MNQFLLTPLCCLIAGSFSSHSAVYFVHGVEYDITAVNTTWQSSFANLATQPWWGSSQAARDFATAVGPTLGGQVPESSVNPDDRPFFAFAAPTGQGPVGAKFISSGTVVAGYLSQPSLSMTYAQAVPRGGSRQFPILPTIPMLLR